MNPRYPVYIVSKGRAESRLTVKALVRLGVPHRVVIEPQEQAAYASVIDPATLLVLPFSNLGQGSIPARNWIWEHALAEGWERHWILDDNIRDFQRLHQNVKYYVTTGTTFRVIEDFVDRYQNVALAGMNYDFLQPAPYRTPPFRLNTRIYSCILINNALPFRWRGRYNEDTDLSIRCLKARWCTVLFCAFLAKKAATMTMPGGNTEDLYKLNDGKDGRLLMAQSLQQQHPDIVRVTHRFHRWQHHVDYRPFRENQLIRKPGVVIPEGVDDYGMELVRLDQAASKA